MIPLHAPADQPDGPALHQSDPAGGRLAGRADWRAGFVPHYSRAQLFVPQAGEYREAVSTSLYVRTGEWQSIEIPLPAGVVPEGPLRLDPTDACGIVEISDMQLMNPNSLQPLWSAGSMSTELSVRGTAIPLRRDGVFSLFSYGDDPMLVLPDLAGVHADSLLRLRMRVRIGEGSVLTLLRSAVDALHTISSASARELFAAALSAPQQAVQMLESLQADQHALRTTHVEIATLKEQLQRADAELAAARHECTENREISNLLRVQLEDARSEARLALEQHQARVLQLERDLDSSRSDALSVIEQHRADVLRLEHRLASNRVESEQAHSRLALIEDERNRLQASLQAILTSWLWRLTAPLRGVGSLFMR
jgi:hypothetical protein